MSEVFLLSDAILLRGFLVQGCSKVEVRVKGTKTVYLDLWGKEFSTNCEKANLRYPLDDIQSVWKEKYHGFC